MESGSDIVGLDNIDEWECMRLAAYVAGPLTAISPEDEPVCRQVRAIARRVLSAKFNVYDPADFTAPGTHHSSDEVFSEDHSRTSNADLVFFHVPSPSIGIGIESQIAAEATVPRVIARPKGRPLSRMFEGVFNPTLVDIEYDSVTDFDAQLMKSLQIIARGAKISASKRRPEIELIRKANCGLAIFKARVLGGITIDQLATATDMRSSILKTLERDSRASATLTLIQLKRIAKELKMTVAITGGQIPTLMSTDDLEDNRVRCTSLDTLYVYLKTRRPQWVDDQLVFAAWRYAFPDIGAGELRAARGNDPTAQGAPVSEVAWHQIFSDLDTSADEDPQLF